MVPITALKPVLNKGCVTIQNNCVEKRKEEWIIQKQ